MLLGLEIENWMSYRESTALLMSATLERYRNDRLPRIANYKNRRILPITAIYGANASGKSNFFEAIRFAQSFVREAPRPDAPIDVIPYRLDKDTVSRPTRMHFEMIIDEILYEYEFSATSQCVVHEHLIRHPKLNREELLFERDETIQIADSIKTPELDLCKNITRPNQLFLTATVYQNQQIFRPVYNWFVNTLCCIAPDSAFAGFDKFVDESSPYFDKINQLLSNLGTGITRLTAEEVAPGFFPFMPPLTEGATTCMIQGKNRIIITRKNGEFKFKKLKSVHQGENGEPVTFDLAHESDGTLRMIDLLPAFLSLKTHEQPTVFVIDELDRSLHTRLLTELLAFYLKNCSATTRSQLIFTTHDVLQMDSGLLRKDEMWIADRSDTGSSTLCNFMDFKEASEDKHIRQSYMTGRMGGIPKIYIQ